MISNALSDGNISSIVQSSLLLSNWRVSYNVRPIPILCLHPLVLARSHAYSLGTDKFNNHSWGQQLKRSVLSPHPLVLSLKVVVAPTRVAED